VLFCLGRILVVDNKAHRCRALLKAEGFALIALSAAFGQDAAFDYRQPMSLGHII
jgi:hypothetical protein